MLRRDRRGLLIDSTAQAQPKRQYFYATACFFPKAKLRSVNWNYTVAGPTGPISVPLHVLWQLSFSLFSWVDGLPRYSGSSTPCARILLVSDTNKTPLEGKVQSKICQRISEWAWWVRKYCFAVTKYLYALMDPYRIDGPVGSGPIIRSHHSLEYSRQTGNTIMGNPAHNSEFKFITPGQHAVFHKHGQAVISGPRAHPPSVLEININQRHYFFPGVTSICKDLTSRWPKLWDLTERGHLSYANSTGAGHQIPVPLVPGDTYVVLRDYVVYPRTTCKARSWGMDQFDDQGPPIAGPAVILLDARRDLAEAPLQSHPSPVLRSLALITLPGEQAQTRSWLSFHIMFCWMWDKPVQCFEIFTPSRISSIRFYPTFPLAFWAHALRDNTTERIDVSRVAHGVALTHLPRNGLGKGLGHVRVTSQLEESSLGVANRRSGHHMY
ncbi:hypothetical protein EDB84DRAFT_1442084 [Lactarius hengduanensis]|nr:hypothetical protein EDB84DRAFT_1442084 [Lactarius hengduanensis]